MIDLTDLIARVEAGEGADRGLDAEACLALTGRHSARGRLAVANLKIVQIVVQVDDGDFCAVSLPPAYMGMLLRMIHALSDGPIKLARLPGVKLIPLAELEN